MISASRNRRTEDVRIESIVVAELKFRDVERHVFGVTTPPLRLTAPMVSVKSGNIASRDDPEGGARWRPLADKSASARVRGRPRDSKPFQTPPTRPPLPLPPPPP